MSEASLGGVVMSEASLGDSGSEASLGGTVTSVASLVEFKVARVWSRWPLIMAAERGGYLRTWVDVNSGHVVSRPASMAEHQVDKLGENMVA